MTKTTYQQMFSRLQRQTLQLLESPPEKRSPGAINNILPWIQNRTQVLKEVEAECLTTLIRQSECQTVRRDDVIIQQGEPGECFYITLVGSVSIYVNPQIEEETENTLSAATTPNQYQKREYSSNNVNNNKPVPKENQNSKDKSQTENNGDKDDTTESVTKKSAVRIDRTKFGTFVIKLCDGQGFGEAALIRNCNRTATVIANEDTSLMVIRKELFVNTLKNYLENDYAKRKSLIENSALFKGWRRRHKLRLELSLIRSTCAFDSVIIRQGEPWKGLVFIAEGQAKLQIEPNRHNTQYKELLPFSEEIDVYGLELNRPTPRAGNEEVVTSSRAEREQVYVRRKEGYAAAEKRVQNRVISLCTVERGDIVGDIEVVTDLKTYSCSVTATTNMELYFLSPDNFNRLISKSSPESQTYNTLQERVKAKLNTRIYSKQGSQIPLYKHLLNGLATQNYCPYSRPVVEPKTSAPLPDSNVMFEHLMSNYLEDKAELVTPRVQGGVYYKDLARIKKKQRELFPQKDLGVIKNVKKNRKIKVHREISHAPRTSTALKKAIVQAREQQVNEAKHKLIREARDKEYAEIRAVKDRLQRSVTESVMERQSNLIVKNPNATQLQPKTTEVQVDIKEPTPNKQNTAQTVSGNVVSTGTFITSLNKTHKSNDNTIEAETNHMSDKTDTKQKEFSLPDIKSCENMPDFSKRKLRLKHSMSVQQFPTIVSEDNTIHQARRGRFGQLSKSGSKSYECLLASQTDEKSTPHLASKELTTFSDFEGLRDSLEPVICENPSYRDWETNDKSLTFLEAKVKDFILRQDMTAKKETLTSLPKLHRYECKDTEEQPIQGGKVLVKSSNCPLSTNSKTVKRYHEHTRCNLLPSIPEYWSLRKQRMVRQAIKDEDRLSWLQKHETNEEKQPAAAVTN